MWMNFCNEFQSISWELSNQSSAMYINVTIQNIPISLSKEIYNILLYYFWII